MLHLLHFCYLTQHTLAHLRERVCRSLNRLRHTPVALSIGVITLVVICHQVCQCEAIVRSDEVDAGSGRAVATPASPSIVGPPAVAGSEVHHHTVLVY